MKYIYFPFVLLVILLSCNLFTACNDEDDSGIPVIHHIRLVDPEKADSTFVNVKPGTMIVVIGENLTNIKKVFINEQQISFNTNYGTSSNLILTVPGDLKLTGANPELKSELRIETSHGVATYPMHVLSPAPYITRIVTTLPVEEGTELNIVGGNFYEIQRVYFTTAVDDLANAPISVEVKDYKVNKDFNKITFNAPAGLIDEGSLVVECYTATTFTPFRSSNLPPIIKGISSMMPITGTTVTISGQNFMDLTSITIGESISVDFSTVKVNETTDTITFTMPAKPEEMCTLTVTTKGGKAEVADFYPLKNIILNYDDIGWHNWGGQSSKVTADGTKAPFFSDGVCISISGEISASNYWWGQLMEAPLYTISESVLPATISTSKLALQFECFVAKEYGEGPVFRIYLKDKDHDYKGYRPVSDFSGETEINQWMQCSIPLSSLVKEATWGDFLKRDSKQLAFEMTNPSKNGPFQVEFYFDNFRIVPMK